MKFLTIYMELTIVMPYFSFALPKKKKKNKKPYD
jgi:hypothetical protein